MTPKLKLGATLALGAVALAVLGAGCFIAGQITGHASERAMMSSADAALLLGVLRNLEANDVPAARKALFFGLETKVIAHWNVAQKGVADYPEGGAPVDVVLIQRAMRGRAAMLGDPVIAELKLAQRREGGDFAAMDSTLQQVERRYLVPR